MANEKETPAYFGILPANVRYDKSLSPYAKLIYSEFSALSNKYGYVFATNKYFADLYDLSETTVSKLINSLAKKGYIAIEMTRNPDNKFITERRIRIVSNAVSSEDSSDLANNDKPEFESKRKPEHCGNDRSNNNNINNKSIKNNNKKNNLFSDDTSELGSDFPTEELLNAESQPKAEEKPRTKKSKKSEPTYLLGDEFYSDIFKKYRTIFFDLKQSGKIKAGLPVIGKYKETVDKVLLRYREQGISDEEVKSNILLALENGAKHNFVLIRNYAFNLMMSENMLPALCTGTNNVNSNTGVGIDYLNQTYDEEF